MESPAEKTIGKRKVKFPFSLVESMKLFSKKNTNISKRVTQHNLSLRVQVYIDSACRFFFGSELFCCI